MSRWTFFRTPSQPSAVPRRSRWPVVLAAAALLWCAAWYCRGESWTLFEVAAGVAALAVVRSRPLPMTTRWVVWCTLAVVVVCLAANVSRLVPPEKAVEGTWNVDRLVTAIFALGVGVLFFRPSANGVTLAAVGGLPMSMMVLFRDPGAPGAAVGHETLFVWGWVALVAAADLAQRMTETVAGEPPALGVREGAKRFLLLAVVVAAAFALRGPVEWTAHVAQKRLLGWVMPLERESRQGVGDMRLNVPTALDLGQRMRVVMLVDAPRLPGYLRQRVFLHYGGGRWLPVKPEQELGAPPGHSAKNAYALVPRRAAGGTARWRVDIVAPAYLTAFCVPGSAVELAYDGAVPLGETNGMVAASERLPGRYELAVSSKSLLESAYPYPDGQGDGAYLDVPPGLAREASNWVARCAGLASAASVRTAVPLVELYFATNFEYRLGVQLASSPDPLVDFMARREGSCTHFASAAALMFRSCGVPSRVVTGFVCSEWNPLLKQWVVRERQEHAWVEVWDDAAGVWWVADPTPPAGSPSAWRQASSFRQMLDLAAAEWKRLLEYLGRANVLEVIADAGALLASFLWHVVWSVPGAAVLIGGGLIAWLRRRARRRRTTASERLREELTRAMLRVERRRVAAHLRRRSAESWEAWLHRVEDTLPDATRSELRTALERYQDLRYGRVLDEAAACAWIDGTRTRRNGPRV